MKKTLIALAVAASTVVSGSAMAWTANGSGGSVDLGGTLTPVVKVTPWEVQVGATVSDLDANIVENQSATKITAKKAIPILGIRTASSDAFVGEAGISPRISYGQALNTNSFKDSTGTITLDMKDAQAQKIGTVTVPMFAGAETSKVSLDKSFKKLYPTFASGTDRSFGGGLPRAADQVAADADSRATALFPDATAHFNKQDITAVSSAANADDFSDNQYTFSAYYVSGVEQGKEISVQLDNPAAANTSIVWNASLPITVSYQ